MTFQRIHSILFGSSRGLSLPLLFSASLIVVSQAACSGESVESGTGGASSVGGAGVGGALVGMGGSSFGTGGAAAGGTSTTGGTGTGGMASGGVGVGGATFASGGAPSGGVGSGGDGSGGAEASGGAGSGGESSAGFSPCPETGPCNILPLGDSITFGLTFDGGYRVELFRMALADGHDVTFTGTQSPNGPMMVDGTPFPRGHEGISGQTIDQIAGRVPAPAFTDMPHIILLHAGTNDMVGNANGAEMRLGSLIDKIIAEAPDALLVVSNIIPLSVGSGVDSFNNAIMPVIQQRIDSGAHVIFSDQFDGFPTSELGDGVHPNEAGYARMAGVWYESISSYLP